MIEAVLCQFAWLRKLDDPRPRRLGADYYKAVLAYRYELRSLMCLDEVLTVLLEVLNFALVLLGLLARVKRAKVSTLTGLWIYFARIEPVSTGWELPDHRLLLPKYLGLMFEFSSRRRRSAGTNG